MKNLVVFSLLLICICSQEAPAQIIAFSDFEDGVIPGLSDYWAQFLNVRPAVLTESDGNDFLRLTVTPSDSGPNYATDPGIVRAELAMGVIDWSVHNPITISYAFRINSDSPPPDMMLGQLYQSGSNSGWTVGLAGMLSGDSMQITVKD